MKMAADFEAEPARGKRYKRRGVLEEAARSPNAITESGLSIRLWRMYGHVWLVCLLFPIISLVQRGTGALSAAIAILALLIFIALYLWLMRPHPIARAAPAGWDLPRLQVALLLMVLLVLSLSVAYGTAFLWLLVGTGAAAGRALPPRRAHLVVTVLPLLALGAGIVLSGGPATTDWMHLLPLALLVRALGLDMTGLSLLSGTIRELHSAQEELAYRAVIEERLRLARDLHDLLGHSLSLIILKSELARRLIENAPTRAATEIQEIEGVARQGLREVREAVAGYRQPTLRDELYKARQVLAVAGIEGVVEHRGGTLPSDIEAVLAWTVREGITNVIRHSRARQCTIHVTRGDRTAMVEVTNDGTCDSGESPELRRGSGLAGLTERVTALGGRIEAGPLNTDELQGFRLWVEIPLGREGTDEREGQR